MAGHIVGHVRRDLYCYLFLMSHSSERLRSNLDDIEELREESSSSDAMSDDAADSPFRPSNSPDQNVTGTPKSRVRFGSSISEARKIAAREADPNDGRCLITNEASPSMAIQAAHVVPRASKSALVRFTVVIFCD